MDRRTAIKGAAATAGLALLGGEVVKAHDEGHVKVHDLPKEVVFFVRIPVDGPYVAVRIPKSRVKD